MNLAILVAMVVVGVSTVVLLVHTTGGSRRSALADAEEASERFSVDYPEAETQGIVLTAGGDAAFIKVEGGRLGVVQVFGSHFLTRLIDARSLARWHRQGATIELVSTDFTWTGGCYVFASSADAERVLAMIESVGNSMTERQET